MPGFSTGRLLSHSGLFDSSPRVLSAFSALICSALQSAHLSSVSLFCFVCLFFSFPNVDLLCNHSVVVKTRTFTLV